MIHKLGETRGVFLHQGVGLVHQWFEVIVRSTENTLRGTCFPKLEIPQIRDMGAVFPTVDVERGFSCLQTPNWFLDYREHVYYISPRQLKVQDLTSLAVVPRVLSQF